MMKFLLSLSLLFVFCCRAGAVSDTIGWSHQRLQWADFKGRSDTATYNKDHFAATVWKLTYFHRRNRSGQVEVIAYAWFDGRHSWVRPSQRSNTALLKHEQGHFDLAELLVRQFKKQISQTNFRTTGYADTLSTLFSTLLANVNDLQLQYDVDTLYGEKPAEQRQWQTYIATALTQLNNYADKRIVSKE